MENIKTIALLGCTGSIGMQTIDIVAQHPEAFKIVAISCGHQIDKLETILTQIHPQIVCVQEENDYDRLQKKYPDITWCYGKEGLIFVSQSTYDILVNALVGFVGFAPTLAAIESKHDVALANKETLVVGGELINRKVKENNVRLVPIDSEHSAIFQALQGNRKEDIKNLWITCSGGAFRNLSREEMKDKTLKDALLHPNWQMGGKITIDCANLMNKGFEVMEAHWLFGIDYDNIKVVLHPESVVHSLIEYVDHSFMAQLGAPDMRLPIQYALTYPHRLYFEENHPLDLYALNALHFSAVDTEKYPLLDMAYHVAKKGGNFPAIWNGANEEANLAFREGKIGFLTIEEILTETIAKAAYAPVYTEGDLIENDKWGREFAKGKISEKYR